MPCPPPGDLPDPGIKPESPALAGGFFTTEPPGQPTEASRYFHWKHHPPPPGLNHPAIPHPPGCSPPWPLISRLFEFCFLFSPDPLPHLHLHGCCLNLAANHLFLTSILLTQRSVNYSPVSQIQPAPSLCTAHELKIILYF